MLWIHACCKSFFVKCKLSFFKKTIKIIYWEKVTPASMAKKIHANWFNSIFHAQYRKAVWKKFYRMNLLLCLEEVLKKTVMISG